MRWAVWLGHNLLLNSLEVADISYQVFPAVIFEFNSCATATPLRFLKDCAASASIMKTAGTIAIATQMSGESPVAVYALAHREMRGIMICPGPNHSARLR